MKYKRQAPEFTWDAENGVATCTIVDDKNRVFIGEAICHDNDTDMMSERTGCELAFRRAKLEHLRTVRDCDIKPALAALQHLYGCMAHSAKFSPKSYEARTIRRHIYQTKFELATIKEMIASEYQGITDYIKGKDKIYHRIRTKKNGQN